MTTPEVKWGVYHFDATGERVTDSVFSTFDLAVQALALFSGKWAANWTVSQLKKGNHFVEKHVEATPDGG